MSYDSIYTKIKVLIISIIFVVAVIFVFFLDTELEWSFAKILYCVIFSIFAFFFPPMVKYIINWFKTLSLEESFYAGYKIGYYGIIGLVLIDPIVGIMYYFNKVFKSSGRGNTSLIIVGFYIVNKWYLINDTKLKKRGI